MATTAQATSDRTSARDVLTHPQAPLCVLLLRLVMGGVLLFAGIGKLEVVTGEPFDASAFLVHGVDPASPVSGLYAWMAETPAILATINTVVPATQLFIGTALVIGAFVRLAALGGAVQMTAFYLGHWEGAWLGLFHSTLVYAVVFAAVGVFAAGRIAGVDRYLEQLEVAGQPLIERYPWMRYLLG